MRASTPATSAAASAHASTTTRASSRSCAGKARADEPLPRGLTPGQPHRQPRHPRRADALRPLVRRRARRLSRARRAARATASGRAARPRPGRRRALARRELPVRAGAARLREDLAGRPHGGRADAARASASASRPSATRRSTTSSGRSSTRPTRRDSRSGASSAPATRTSRRRSSRAAASSRRSTRTPAPIPAFDLVAGTVWSLTRDDDRHPRGRAPDRRAVRRRGGPALARRRARRRYERPLARPARRPEPAAAGLAGIPSRELGALGAAAPPRRRRDDPARPRPLPRGDLAAAARALRRSRRTRTTRDGSRPRPVTATRSLAAGNGPVWLEVAHDHRGQSSVEEAEAVAAAVAGLVGSPFTDEDGSTRPLRDERHPRRRPVQRAGTHAALAPARRRRRSARSTSSRGSRRRSSFVSMASSTAEEAPRGLGFAFDRHRFNVATSRAQCRAVLACTPGAARRRLQDDRADATRQRRVLVRGARGAGVGSS